MYFWPSSRWKNCWSKYTNAGTSNAYVIDTALCGCKLVVNVCCACWCNQKYESTAINKVNNQRLGENYTYVGRVKSILYICTLFFEAVSMHVFALVAYVTIYRDSPNKANFCANRKCTILNTYTKPRWIDQDYNWAISMRKMINLINKQ